MPVTCAMRSLRRTIGSAVGGSESRVDGRGGALAASQFNNQLATPIGRPLQSAGSGRRSKRKEAGEWSRSLREVRRIDSGVKARSFNQ